MIASPDPRKPDINWHAADLGMDYQSHHVLMHKVTICQGDIIVVADKAERTGMDLRDSHWVLTGHVHVTAESHGELHSDEATLDFSKSLLAHAVVTGQPAQFEQTQSISGVLARGHADSIDYDVTAGTVRLSDNAWLSNGPSNEMTAPELVYNIRLKQIQGTGSPTGGRFHAIVQPRPEKTGKAGPKRGSGNPVPAKAGSASTPADNLPSGSRP